MAKCRDCGADIRWLKTHTGRNVPINSEDYLDHYSEDVPDDFSTHWQTCRKPKEEPLTQAQKTRPGYL